jgi:hypothetical protein
LIAYFLLTYAFSWALWIPLQQLVLDGRRALMPLISLGVFGPALVSIGLSAVLEPRPRQGCRGPAVIAFIMVWILASLIIVANLVVNEEMELSTPLVVISATTGLLPALWFLPPSPRYRGQEIIFALTYSQRAPWAPTSWRWSYSPRSGSWAISSAVPWEWKSRSSAGLR